MKFLYLFFISFFLLEASTRILKILVPIEKYHFLKSYWAENRYFFDLIRHGQVTQSTPTNFDSLLGWRNKPGQVAKNHEVIKLNSALWRDSHEFKIEKNKKRIAIVGDSFSFGVDLPDGQTYADYLRKELPEFEIYNFGIAGFGLDQMALNATQNVLSYKPDLILFSFIADDFSRACFDFTFDAKKPYFESTSTGLKVSGTPVPSKEALIKTHSLFSSRVEDAFKTVLLQSDFISFAGHVAVQKKFLNCYESLGPQILSWVKEKTPKEIQLKFFHLDGTLSPNQLELMKAKEIEFVSLPPLLKQASEKLNLPITRLPDGHPDKELNQIYAYLIASKLTVVKNHFP